MSDVLGLFEVVLVILEVHLGRALLAGLPVAADGVVQIAVVLINARADQALIFFEDCLNLFDSHLLF